MDDHPLVTIVVATMNADAGLRRTLASIAAQDYPAMEVVVVDGGSTDGTAQAVQTSPAAISRFISEPDRGVADAYNKGIAVASGDWIYFLNADDEFHAPHVLRDVMVSTDAAPDLIIGKVEADTGRIFDGRLGWPLCIRNTVHHQGMFYRRSFLAARPFNITYRRYGHDHEHNLRLWREGAGVRYIDTIVARWATGGISDDARWKDYREEFKVRRNTIGALAPLFDVFTPLRYVVKRARKRLAAAGARP